LVLYDLKNEIASKVYISKDSHESELSFSIKLVNIKILKFWAKFRVKTDNVCNTFL
jgi:hypothetical protein